MSAADERAALLRLAETEPDELTALSGVVLGHAFLSDGHGGWRCGCGYLPRLGELHARHVAREVVALQRRRGWRP